MTAGSRAEAAPVLSLENVAFGYPGRPALFGGIDFSLREGERMGLSGPNGSGKTTLLRILLGLEIPSAGRVLYRGRPIGDAGVLRSLRRGAGLVLQNSDDQIFSATVLEDVAFGPLNLGLPPAAARERALATLEELGAGCLASRATHRLSAGEKKLAAIAGVLAMRPAAILLDEPTAGLDSAARERVAGVLLRLDAAQLIVTHDMEFIGKVAGRVAEIKDGRMEMP